MAATDQHYRSQWVLDSIFAASCALMLLATGWMFWQDYNREFKSVQRTFRDVESGLAEREMVEKMPDASLVAEKRRALKAARVALEKARGYLIDADGLRVVEEPGPDGAIVQKKVAPPGRPPSGKESAEVVAPKTLAAWDSELKARRDTADEAYRTVKAEFDSKTTYYNSAVDEAARCPTSSPRRAGLDADVEKRKEELAKLEEQRDAKKNAVDALDTEIRSKVRDWLAGPRKAVEDADASEKAVTKEFDRFAKLAAQKAWNVGDTFRALPILDGFESPTKIRQIWLPELTIDYSFKEVPRYDRCTSCHLGIDRPAMQAEALAKLSDAKENRRLGGKLAAARTMLEKRQAAGEDLGFDPADLPGEQRVHLGLITLLLVLSSLVAALSLGLLERSARVGLWVLLGCLVVSFATSGALAVFAPRVPGVKTVPLHDGQVKQYAAHPRLDLFVDSNSPHSMEKFGCTICHDGQGSATSFTLASHTPNDALEQQKWKDRHDWERIHYWDFPMHPGRFIESSCVKCHHQMTDLVTHGAKEEAPKLLRGYNLVKENGCFGCHEIAGQKAGRSVGPDLRLEPTPALDYLSAAEQERAQADPANPPGTMRKVGPSLRRVAEKTNEDWVRQWVQSPRGFRPDTKMPHFYGLSTNSPGALPDEQKAFPAVEVHAIAHYLLAESKDHLAGKDFTSDALLHGKHSVLELQDRLVKAGLPDKEKKELFDVSRRWHDVALLSAPRAMKRIQADAQTQRQLQERLVELHRNLADLKGRRAAESELKPAQDEIAAAGKELDSVTKSLIEDGRATPVAREIVDEDGHAVRLPEKGGNAVNGRRLFTEKGCLACHAHQGTTRKGEGVASVGSAASFGPELSRVAAKLVPAVGKKEGRRWLVQWLLNPNVHSPRTRMPITHLTVADANDVASWLLAQPATGWEPADPPKPDLASLKALARVYLAKAPGFTHTDRDAYLPATGDAPGIPKDRLAALPRDAEERRLEAGKVTRDALLWYVGRKAIGRQGCYACHDIPGFETAKPIGVALNDWGKKDPERLAFEDAETFARTHYNLVPSRKTRLDVQARRKALLGSMTEYLKKQVEALKEKKQDASAGAAEKDVERLSKELEDLDKVPEAGPDLATRDKELVRQHKELRRLDQQLRDQGRIHELEAKAATKEGLTPAETRELAKLGPEKLFERREGKEPVEEIFFEALGHAHQSRAGFLHQKLLAPRSYDFNRERAWDDRLRMPQFKFARTRPLPGESAAAHQARQDKEEAEAREAVMTFILGLVAEPVPPQYVAQPKADHKAEVLGRQVLEKYNCAGCHQVRPGVFEFKPSDGAVREQLAKAYTAAAGAKGEKLGNDFVFANHNAWRGAPQHGPREIAYGYPDPASTAALDEQGVSGVDVIYLTDALHFTGPDRLARDLPAASKLYLPQGKYRASAPFGGTFTDLLVPYLEKKDSTLKGKPDAARSILPPPLVREGERVQPDWLYKFLLNPGPVRPESYMLLRMPKFNLSPDEARALVNYFAAVSRRTNPGAGVTYPYVTIDQRDPDYWKRMTARYVARLKPKDLEARARQLRPVWEAKAQKDLDAAEQAVRQAKRAEKAAKDGKSAELPAAANAVKLAEKRRDGAKAVLAKAKKGDFAAQEKHWKESEIYAQDAFKLLTNKNLCLQCHNVGPIHIEGVKGPNLALSAERLRPEWAEEWIAHPRRLFTYSPIMPQNFPNGPDPLKWLEQGAFVGSPLQQTRAVRDILMDLPRLNALLATPTPPPAAGGSKK
jgi:cbb3-type cytochrome oxidase cytochrome c subunit